MEAIFHDLKSLGFSLGFCKAIEAFVGKVWIADASKDRETYPLVPELLAHRLNGEAVSQPRAVRV